MNKRLLYPVMILGVFLIASCRKDTDAPIVNTLDAHTITTTTAIVRGSINSDGGASVSECGICWNTSDNPTTDDNKTTESGKLTFESKISSLSPGETYYARAYATNKVGTSYGESVSFTTADFELTKSTDFPGPGRLNPLSFSYNGKGYYGLGISSYGSNGNFLRDFWSFDPSTSSWTRLKDCPFDFDFKFIFNLYSTKCLVGSTVYIPNKNYIYTYDIILDNWKLLLWTDISMYYSSCFSVDGRAFFFRTSFGELFEYVPGTAMLKKKDAVISNFGNAELNEIFVINNEAYMLNKSYENIEIFHYLPLSDTWEKKLEKKFTSIEFRNAAFVIVLDNCAFIGQSTSFTNTGTLENPVIKPDSPGSGIWKYDCVKNEFTQCSSMPGVLRAKAGSFSFTDKAYIIGGHTVDQITRNFSPLNDTWIMTR